MYDYYNFSYVPPLVAAQAQREADAAKAEAAAQAAEAEKAHPTTTPAPVDPTWSFGDAKTWFTKHWPLTQPATALPPPSSQPGVSTGTAKDR